MSLLNKIFLATTLILFANNVFSEDIFDIIKSNDYKAIKKYKGDLNVRDENLATPFMWAIYSADIKTVKKLYKKGADPNLKGWIKFIDSVRMSEFMYGSCLVIAAGENKLDILEYFLKNLEIPANDKEFNLYDGKENGWQALHWATIKGNIEAAGLLLKYGAPIDCEAETDHHQTPLHFALKYKNNDMARLLIDKGADINKLDDYYNSPLLYALHFRNKEIVKYLIEKGARPSVQGLNINELLLEYFGVGSYQEL